MDEEIVEEEPPALEAKVESVIEPVRESRRGHGRSERSSFERQAARGENVEPDANAEPRPEGEEDSEAFARSRRRRRRRGRGGGNGAIGELAQPGAEQPSDEALGFMAHLEGTPTAEEGRRPEREGQGRGRGRGPGRWTRSTPLAPEYKEPEIFPVDQGAQYSADFIAPSEAHLPRFDEPAVLASELHADAAAVSETGKQYDSESAPQTPVAVGNEAPPVEESGAKEAVADGPPAQPAPEPAPRPKTEVVITSADPAQPKKGGWWQRAKATLGGGE